MIAVAYDRFTAIYNSTNGEELWSVTSPNSQYYYYESIMIIGL